MFDKIIGGMLIALPFLNIVYKGVSEFEMVFLCLAILLILLVIKLLFKRHDFKIYYFDILILAYLVYGLLSNTLVKQLETEPLFYLKWGLIILMYFSARILFDDGRKIILTSIIFSGFIQAIIAELQFFGLLDSLSEEFAVTGSFSNPSHLGIYLAISLTMLLTTLLMEWNLLKLSIKVAGICLSVFMIPAFFLADSRTAFLAVMISGIILFFKSHGFIRLEKGKKRLVFVTVWLLGLISVALLYLYRPSSANSRLLIWNVSKDLFFEKPIFGHGSGSFPSMYMYSQAEYFFKNPSSEFTIVSNNHYQAFNEFIHLACEQGIVGLLLFVTILYFIFYSKGKMVLKLALTTLLIASCFSYSFDVFPLMLLFPTFIGLLAPKEEAHFITFQINAFGRFVSSIVFCGALAVTIIFWKQYQKTEDSLIHLMQEKDIKTISTVKDNYDFIKKNMMFSFIFTKQISQMDDTEYALSVFQESTKYFVTSEMMIDEGMLYQKIKDYKAAEDCFTTAYFMNPSRILPNYHLFRLYKETGDNAKAIKTAKLILAQPVSVVGSITLRIRKEVRDYLSKTLPK
ncbi:MAG: O-antigen ligase family protein [Bacteroidales bacterium]|jgi:O-antigen ligase|nr:O-antigen ligase family protein [Bacteroidales bacterium]